MKKSKDIESVTDIIPFLIAETVASKVIWEKYKKEFTSGNVMSLERQEEIQKETDTWTEYLTKRAEYHFKTSDSFYKKICSKALEGNAARDFLYSFMYHWMGVTDLRVFSAQLTTDDSKTNYHSAEKSMNEWIKAHANS